MKSADVKRFRSYATFAARFGHAAWSKYCEGDDAASRDYATSYRVEMCRAYYLWTKDYGKRGMDWVSDDTWPQAWEQALREAAAREGIRP